MSVRRYAAKQIAGEIVYAGSRPPQFVLADTEAELPFRDDAVAGDLAFAADSATLWVFSEDDWQQLWPAAEVPEAGVAVGEADGDPAFEGITEIQFDQGDGFTLMQPEPGVVRVGATGTPAPDNDAQILAWLGL